MICFYLLSSFLSFVQQKHREDINQVLMYALLNQYPMLQYTFEYVGIESIDLRSGSNNRQQHRQMHFFF